MTPKQKRLILATEPENGTRLRVAIRVLGLRSVDVARLADVRQALVCDVMAGRRHPNFDNARRLAGALGLFAEELCPVIHPRKKRAA